MINYFEEIGKGQKNSGSNAFAAASWLALAIGSVGYITGLWNAELLNLEEKGFYLIALLFGLFSAVSVQKTVRDKMEEIPVSGIYYGICWAALCLSILLMGVGLYNTESLELNEKGFFVMSFVLSLFASVAVQKNTRDSLSDQKLSETR